MREVIIGAFAASLSLVVMSVSATAHEPGGKGKAAAHAGPHSHGALIGKPGDPKAVTRTVEVKMYDTMRFEPESIQVGKGETVRFVVKNLGAIKHEMVLGTSQELKDHAALMEKFPEMEHDDPNGVTVEPGETDELVWTFTVAGDVLFACLMPGHYQSGMVGRVGVKS